MDIRVELVNFDNFVADLKRFSSELSAETVEVLRYIDADLKKISDRVLEKAKEICCSKSVIINLDQVSSLFFSLFFSFN